jgi:hypothetical protein
MFKKMKAGVKDLGQDRLYHLNEGGHMQREGC